MHAAEMEKYTRSAYDALGHDVQGVYNTLMCAIARPLVKEHKKWLGRQHLTVILGSENRRFWVWRLHPDVVLLVNDHKGIVLDVTENASKADILNSINQYLVDMLGQREV